MLLWESVVVVLFLINKYLPFLFFSSFEVCVSDLYPFTLHFSFLICISLFLFCGYSFFDPILSDLGLESSNCIAKNLEIGALALPVC